MDPGSKRDFTCSWEHCGKSFHHRSDLSRHYRIHTNDRPYHCDVKNCDKRFIQRSTLTVHSRTHTGEKPYSCDHEGCQKAFADSSTRARHRRIHTGERPYICQERTCGRSFRRKAALAKHQFSLHSLGSLDQVRSVGSTLEHPDQHETTAAMAIFNSQDQNPFTPQHFFPQTASHSLGPYSSQGAQTNSVLVYDGYLSRVAQSVPSWTMRLQSAKELAPPQHHAPQHYLTRHLQYQLQQQQLNQSMAMIPQHYRADH
ncbi:zinc finger protein, partial [Penicillium canescens]